MQGWEVSTTFKFMSNIRLLVAFRANDHIRYNPIGNTPSHNQAYCLSGARPLAWTTNRGVSVSVVVRVVRCTRPHLIVDAPLSRMMVVLVFMKGCGARHLFGWWWFVKERWPPSPDVWHLWSRFYVPSSMAGSLPSSQHLTQLWISPWVIHRSVLALVLHDFFLRRLPWFGCRVLSHSPRKAICRSSSPIATPSFHEFTQKTYEDWDGSQSKY